MISNINSFLDSIKSRDPAARSTLSILLAYPGVKAVFFHFVARFFYLAKFELLARVISQVTRFFTGIEIHPGAKIGKNLFIEKLSIKNILKKQKTPFYIYSENQIITNFLKFKNTFKRPKRSGASGRYVR